jgi:hypothetical protein
MEIKRLLAAAIGIAILGLVVGVAPARAQAAPSIVTGKVTAVSQNQLVVAGGDNKSFTFVVNGDTDVLAKGATKATKATKAAGGSTTIATFVHVGDTVSVRHKDAGGTMTASEVRVTIVGK